MLFLKQIKQELYRLFALTSRKSGMLLNYPPITQTNIYQNTNFGSIYLLRISSLLPPRLYAILQNYIYGCLATFNKKSTSAYISIGKQPKPVFICNAKSFTRLCECPHFPCFADLSITFVLYSFRSVRKWSLSSSNLSFNILGYLSHVLMPSFPEGDLLRFYILILESF